MTHTIHFTNGEFEVCNDVNIALIGSWVIVRTHEGEDVVTYPAHRINRIEAQEEA